MKFLDLIDSVLNQKLSFTNIEKCPFCYSIIRLLQIMQSLKIGGHFTHLHFDER